MYSLQELAEQKRNYKKEYPKEIWALVKQQIEEDEETLCHKVAILVSQLQELRAECGLLNCSYWWCENCVKMDQKQEILRELEAIGVDENGEIY